MLQHNMLEKIAENFIAGGDIMFAILILSLVMWFLAIYKTIRLIRESRKELSPCVCMKLWNKNPEICQRDLPIWQYEIIHDYTKSICDDKELNRDVLDSIRIRHESNAMRFIGTILLLAAAAPLLGLLGTVSGMISTFDVIAQFGTGNARALASGISEALITTQSGLVAAAPGLILGGILYSKGEKLKNRIELFCIKLQEQTDGLKLHG